MSVVQVGELLFDNAFSMFEAMSAIEIGDPKLDAGVPSQAGPRYGTVRVTHALGPDNRGFLHNAMSLLDWTFTRLSISVEAVLPWSLWPDSFSSTALTLCVVLTGSCLTFQPQHSCLQQM